MKNLKNMYLWKIWRISIRILEILWKIWRISIRILVKFLKDFDQNSDGELVGIVEELQQDVFEEFRSEFRYEKFDEFRSEYLVLISGLINL